MAVVDVLIRGKYEAGKAFASLDTALKHANEGAGKTLGTFGKWTEGFADVKAGFDIISGAAMQLGQAAAESYQAVVTETVNYAKEVRDLSRTIGATAEESSKLIQAADDMGVGYSTLTAAMEGAIRKGVEPSIDGIAQLADQYNSIQNPIEKTKFLMDTFGRAGADLGPLMEIGATGIRDLGTAAEEAGLVMDEKAVQAARNYEIALDNLTDRIDAQKIKWGNDWIPVATDVMDINVRMAETVEKNGLEWMNIIPVLGGARDVFLLISESIKKSGEDANKAAGEIAAAQNQLISFQSYAGNVPVMGHGQSYKAGQGPAYPYSDSNPTGYVLDPQTGAKSYPGRANGGSMVGGVSYLVGERGPEIVTPGTNSTITPTGSAGGGTVISLSFPSMFPPSDPAQLERVLRPAIDKAIREKQATGRL